MSFTSFLQTYFQERTAPEVAVKALLWLLREGWRLEMQMLGDSLVVVLDAEHSRSAKFQRLMLDGNLMFDHADGSAEVHLADCIVKWRQQCEEALRHG